MEREEPPPMTTENSGAKLFDDIDDDDLFKSAIDVKVPQGGGSENEDDTSKDSESFSQVFLLEIHLHIS